MASKTKYVHGQQDYQSLYKSLAQLPCCAKCIQSEVTPNQDSTGCIAAKLEEAGGGYVTHNLIHELSSEISVYS